MRNLFRPKPVVPAFEDEAFLPPPAPKSRRAQWEEERCVIEADISFLDDTVQNAREAFDKLINQKAAQRADLVRERDAVNAAIQAFDATIPDLDYDLSTLESDIDAPLPD